MPACVADIHAGVPSICLCLVPRPFENGMYDYKRNPLPEFTSELYRPSDHNFSAKLMPTFADRRVSRSRRDGSPTAVISIFLTEAATFSFK
jgi:hypothetical protein